MDSAETNAEVLLFKDNRDVFEDSIRESAKVVLACRDTFEFAIGVNLS